VALENIAPLRDDPAVSLPTIASLPAGLGPTFRHESQFVTITCNVQFYYGRFCRFCLPDWKQGIAMITVVATVATVRFPGGSISTVHFWTFASALFHRQSPGCPSRPARKSADAPRSILSKRAPLAIGLAAEFCEH
jgi:hypothetical protein